MVVLACFSYLSASAYDFVADGLYFTITSLKDLTVSVDGDVSTDKLVIPQTVVYKGRTLTVTSVGNKAFSGASYVYASPLQSVSLPNTILSIGDYAFSDNINLTEVVLPEQLLEIGSHAFSYTSIKDIRFPSSLTSIGEYAFSRTKLCSIALPDNMEYIPPYCFYDCDSLKSIQLPKRLRSIGYCAFEGCKSLRAIYVYAEKVPILPYNSCAFEGCDSKKCKVYVPIGTYDAYSRSEFGYFENIVEFDASSFRNTIATAENQDTTHYVVNDKKEHTH